MSFHDVQFPSDLSFGSRGGPERRTEIVTLNNGFEERNSPWAHSRRRYDAGLGMRSLDDLSVAIAFFEARRGRLHAFRWKDWADFKSCAPSAAPSALDQEIGVGDGVTRVFALVKQYASGPDRYTRPIRKPVAGSVVVALDGADQAEGSDFTLDAATGEIQFATAPQSGVVITAGYEFDVPVRFDTDRIETSLSGFAAGEIPAIPIVEVRI